MDDGSRQPRFALVTGGAFALGPAIAKRLARDGWRVGINCNSDLSQAEELARGIRDSGGEAVVLPCDLSDPHAVREMFDRVQEDHGPVQVLVNNAETRVDRHVSELAEDEWQRVLDANLIAAVNTTRCTLRPMIRARFGRVINIASVWGVSAHAELASYAASKAALIGLTKTLAAEVAHRGVTVNAVAPGLIDLPLPETVYHHRLEEVPARRLGEPHEVAACVGFLASEDASYVTGSVLTVDGGLSA